MIQDKLSELSVYEPNDYIVMIIFYFNRETQDPSILGMAVQEIHRHYPNWRNFQPRSVFIATWDEVGYYDQQIDAVRTKIIYTILEALERVGSFYHCIWMYFII